MIKAITFNRECPFCKSHLKDAEDYSSISEDLTELFINKCAIEKKCSHCGATCSIGIEFRYVWSREE